MLVLEIACYIFILMTGLRLWGFDNLRDFVVRIKVNFHKQKFKVGYKFYKDGKQYMIQDYSPWKHAFKHFYGCAEITQKNNNAISHGLSHYFTNDLIYFEEKDIPEPSLLEKELDGV